VNTANSQHPQSLGPGDRIRGHMLLVGRYDIACQGGKCSLARPSGAQRVFAMAKYVDKITVMGTRCKSSREGPLIELPENVSCCYLSAFPWYLVFWPVTVLRVALAARRVTFVRLRLTGYVGCLGYLGARLARKPVHFYIGGAPDTAALTSPRLSWITPLKRLRAKFDDWLIRRVIRGNLVICCDEDLAASLRPDAGRTHGFKMSNLLLPEDFVNPDTIAGDWDKPVKILVAATLNPGKGIQELIRAVANLKQRGYDVILRVAGDGRYRGELVELADRLGVAEDVEFLGMRSRDEIRQEYRQADIFCLPSHAEGSPKVIPEAMAAGLPTIATDVGNVTNIIRNGQNGLILQPEDVEALTDALASLLDDRDFALSIARAGRQTVGCTGLDADTREFMGIVAHHLALDRHQPLTSH